MNVQPDCEVAEILVGPKMGFGLGSQGKATGVRIAGGSYRISVKPVVVNADPMYAYSSIVPEEFRIGPGRGRIGEPRTFVFRD